MPLIAYSPEYWDNYYSGSYEETFHFGFPLERILKKEWASQFQAPPRSFADIGCGCGQTLLRARELLPKAEIIYGVENQEIPTDRIASKDLIIGDFMEIYPQLPQVDLLYVSCSMYIKWKDQLHFLTECLNLAKKAITFANVYISDGTAIPQDSLRCVIYKDPQSFASAIGKIGNWKQIGTTFFKG